MKREFTQRLRDLANTTNFRVVKDKIKAYFTLHDEIDLDDDKQAGLIMSTLKPFMAKDKAIHDFCKAFEHRKALKTLGASQALMEIKKSKLYSSNSLIKNRVDELIGMKDAGVPEIKIFENYKNEVQGLVLDNFFKKYMSDAEAKYKQFRAYAYVDEAINKLGESPNPELLGDVFKKLENAMSIPAAQIPFYLTKALNSEKHLSPVIGELLSKLAAIDPMTQRNTMNQIRYVGNAGIYESVVTPCLFGEQMDTVMLGNRLFNISEDHCEEPEEGTVDESFVEVCRAFSMAKISESGAVSVTDDNDNCVEIDEAAEGGLVLTVNKNHSVQVDEAKGWQAELLAMQIHPGVVQLVDKLCESLESITSMDNVMSLQSKSGGGYQMFFVKQGRNNHMITIDPIVGAAAIHKNISVQEACAAANEAFGVDVSKFFGEARANENAEVEAQMQELQGEIDEVDASIAEINNADETVKGDPEVQELLKNLEQKKADMCGHYDQLAGQLVSSPA